MRATADALRAALADLNEMREAVEGEGLDQVRRLSAGNGLREVLAADRCRLEPPGAPARIDEIALQRRDPHNRAEIGGHVGNPRPLPHDLHFGQEWKQFEHVTHEAFLELQGRARGIERIGVGGAAHDELAARGLRDIDVQAA